MKTTMDAAGRVVLPKGCRDRLGLRPGQELRVEETEVGLLITPTSAEPRIVTTPEGPIIVPEDAAEILTDEMVRDLLESGRP